MLEDIGFGDLFLKLRGGCVFLLGIQEALKIINLTRKSVIRDFIEVVPQNEPHSESKQELGNGKNREIGQREPPTDGESSHHLLIYEQVRRGGHTRLRVRCEST